MLAIFHCFSRHTTRKVDETGVARTRTSIIMWVLALQAVDQPTVPQHLSPWGVLIRDHHQICKVPNCFPLTCTTSTHMCVYTHQWTLLSFPWVQNRLIYSYKSLEWSSAKMTQYGLFTWCDSSLRLQWEESCLGCFMNLKPACKTLWLLAMSLASQGGEKMQTCFRKNRSWQLKLIGFSLCL